MNLPPCTWAPQKKWGPTPMVGPHGETFVHPLCSIPRKDTPTGKQWFDPEGIQLVCMQHELSTLAILKDTWLFGESLVFDTFSIGGGQKFLHGAPRRTTQAPNNDFGVGPQPHCGAPHPFTSKVVTFQHLPSTGLGTALHRFLYVQVTHMPPSCTSLTWSPLN